MTFGTEIVLHFMDEYKGTDINQLLPSIVSQTTGLYLINAAWQTIKMQLKEIERRKFQ